MSFHSIKKLFSAVFLLSVCIINGCGKSDPNNPTPENVKNCNDLVTDTAGTGDKAIVVIPNAFTPNGDGINDVYKPLTKNIAAIEFSIFDKDNNIVYSTTTLGGGWQPAAAPINTGIIYYYRIQATTAANHKIGVCGNVHFITCLQKDELPHLYFADQLSPDYTFSMPTAENLPACQ